MRAERKVWRYSVWAAVVVVVVVVLWGEVGGPHAQPQQPATAGAGGVAGSLVVDDVLTLRALEAEGLGFAVRVAGVAAENNEEMAKSSRYQSFIKVIRQDIQDIWAADTDAGVGLKYAHRTFNPAWLTDARMRFHLVAVVNRIDRRVFAKDKTCGETRLIYRLGYAVGGERAMVSRLPMTVNVVYRVADDGQNCKDVGALWSADWVKAQLVGPMAGKGALALRSVEVNVQSVRWPGTVHPSLGGHAEYILRVFHPTADNQTYAPAVLENTPDVAALSKDKAQRQALVEWLRDPKNLAAIDQGTALLPEHFLARKVVSSAPHGLARLGNRGFSQLIKAEDLEGLDLSGTTYIQSPRAMLRRLDAMTCAGCHQSRSVAGFHLLGREPDPLQVVDALEISSSPHFQDELGRRAHYMADVVAGHAPDEVRPPPEYDPHGALNSRCGLGDPGFEGWRCGGGSVCLAAEDPEVGLCVPEGGHVAGDPCEIGVLSTKAVPNKDRIRDVKEVSCGDFGVCESSAVGFPGGMCAASCAVPGHHGVCGSIPLLVDFNKCVASQKPLHDCIIDNTRPAGMRACDDKNPCRDDYICARTGQAMGACMPPYFLFQMRVDGHPL